MPDYGRYCPVALGSEVVADRWTPLIIRELVLGSTRFNDIARCLPGISRSLLTQRLRFLERRGVVEMWPSPTGRGNEYHLTPAGKDLESVIDALGRWSVEWMFDDLHPEEMDSVPLIWWMHRRINADHMPPGRVVIEFHFTGPTRETMWMVLDRGDASVCVQHPGFDTDVLVTAETPALANVFQGYESWAHAVATDSIRISGKSGLVKAFPRWFLWSPFADATRERASRAAQH